MCALIPIFALNNLLHVGRSYGFAVAESFAFIKDSWILRLRCQRLSWFLMFLAAYFSFVNLPYSCSSWDPQFFEAKPGLFGDTVVQYFCSDVVNRRWINAHCVIFIMLIKKVNRESILNWYWYIGAKI
jgi:hypothetical protein